MRVPIELVTAQDVKEFTQICQGVDAEVRVIGKDEHGSPWELSAKSLFCSLILSAQVQMKRSCTAHDVDWNTIICVCEKDIYSQIKRFVKMG